MLREEASSIPELKGLQRRTGQRKDRNTFEPRARPSSGRKESVSFDRAPQAGPPGVASQSPHLLGKEGRREGERGSSHQRPPRRKTWRALFPLRFPKLHPHLANDSVEHADPRAEIASFNARQ